MPIGREAMPTQPQYKPMGPRWALQLDVVNALLQAFEDPDVTEQELIDVALRKDVSPENLPVRTSGILTDFCKRRYGDDVILTQWTPEGHAYLDEKTRGLFATDLNRQKEWLQRQPELEFPQGSKMPKEVFRAINARHREIIEELRRNRNPA